MYAVTQNVHQSCRGTKYFHFLVTVPPVLVFGLWTCRVVSVLLSGPSAPWTLLRPPELACSDGESRSPSLAFVWIWSMRGSGRRSEDVERVRTGHLCSWLRSCWAAVRQVPSQGPSSHQPPWACSYSSPKTRSWQHFVLLPLVKCRLLRHPWGLP